MALALRRRYGETIVLHTSDGEVVIWVNPRRAVDAVLVCIDAPPAVNIVRGEIDVPR